MKKVSIFFATIFWLTIFYIFFLKELSKAGATIAAVLGIIGIFYLFTGEKKTN